MFIRGLGSGWDRWEFTGEVDVSQFDTKGWMQKYQNAVDAFFLSCRSGGSNEFSKKPSGPLFADVDICGHSFKFNASSGGKSFYFNSEALHLEFQFNHKTSFRGTIHPRGLQRQTPDYRHGELREMVKTLCALSFLKHPFNLVSADWHRDQVHDEFPQLHVNNFVGRSVYRPVFGKDKRTESYYMGPNKVYWKNRKLLTQDGCWEVRPLESQGWDGYEDIARTELRVVKETLKSFGLADWESFKVGCPDLPFYIATKIFRVVEPFDLFIEDSHLCRDYVNLPWWDEIVHHAKTEYTGILTRVPVEKGRRSWEHDMARVLRGADDLKNRGKAICRAYEVAWDESMWQKMLDDYALFRDAGKVEAEIARYAKQLKRTLKNINGEVPF